MTVNNHCFVEWKEQFVSQERGNRVVHYYLKDSDGESILAVVGNERSVRHMFYVVAEEFLEVYGKEGFIHAGYKWRSRREVVDWLTSMLSKQHLQGDRSVSPICNTIEGSETADRGISQHTQIADDKGLLISNFKGHDSDIVWSGVAWTCGKQLKHYPAFFRNGIQIAIQSFVYVMAKGENHYIAYLEDMYEDRRGQKKIKVRWFHHNKEVRGVIPVRNPHPQEVFITPHSQVISVECVDGPATVLTREHYEKCLSAFSSASPDKIHLCFRQVRSNKVKPFDLSKLRGYFDQPILSCLQLISFQNHESKCNSLFVDEDEKLSSGDNVKLGAKRTRDGKGSPLHGQGVRKLIKSQQMVVYADYARSDRRLDSLKKVGTQPWYNPIYKVGEKIELLCQDSGIRGCWFRCTVMHLSRRHMKVQYDDVQDEDGSGNLEEWIPAFKLARPDKLGMRHSDRPTIRPAPSYKEQGELAVQVGTAVDAWWSDGWWEGVVTQTEDCSNDSVQVYFPGEGLLMKLCKKDLRISRDWLGDRWIDIEAKPDIVLSIFADDNSNAKPSVAPSIGKDVDSAGFAMSSHEVHVTNKSSEQDVSEDKLVCSEGGAKDMNWNYSDQKPSPKEKSTQGDSTEINGGCDNEINGNNDGKDSNDDDNKNVDSDDQDREAFGTSEDDCKSVEHMEDVV